MEMEINKKGQKVNINQIKTRQMLELVKSILNHYMNYITFEELEKIKEINSSSNLNIEELERFFTPILQRIWTQELNSGKYIVISWNKYAEPKTEDITFATLSSVDNIISFCNLEEGIECEISWQALIGACPKDGATLIEGKEKKSEYTIGEINGKIINSYNFATKFITPIQLISEVPNDYKSKHNELILNTSLIRKIDLNSKNK
ncbi:MAG: hypothetical protein HFE04_02920 [Bacilli bacterium]|nr:hypothetical protein [Bacilli bacterium]